MADDASSAGEPFVPGSQANVSPTGEVADAEVAEDAADTDVADTGVADAGSADDELNAPAAGATPDAASDESNAPAAGVTADAAPADGGTPQPGIGSIEADESGVAQVAMLAEDLSLSEDNAILDRSILIYDAAAEDVAGQSAVPGIPVACGVIRSTAAPLSQRPEDPSDTSFSMRSERERAGTTQPET
jgi:hypothetical protein